MDFDPIDGDLLSRVLEQAPRFAVPPAARGRAEPAPQSGKTWTHPGILGSSRIMTSFGQVPAQLVRVGDTLRTRDGSFARVRRISDLRIDEDFLASRPDAAPVLVQKNAARQGMPLHEVALSPAQMVSVGPNRFEDRLVRADTLSRTKGSIDGTLGMLVYYCFHLSEGVQINCEGLWVAAEWD